MWNVTCAIIVWLSLYLKDFCLTNAFNAELSPVFLFQKGIERNILRLANFSQYIFYSCGQIYKFSKITTICRRFTAGKRNLNCTVNYSTFFGYRSWKLILGFDNFSHLHSELLGNKYNIDIQYIF